MRHALPTLAVTLATLVAAPVSAFTPERAAIMVDAVRAQSCTLTGEQAEAVLAPLGLDPMEVQTFVDVLFESDLVSISESGNELSLSQGLCDANADDSLAMLQAAFAVAEENALQPWRPEVDPAQGALMINAIRENACQMSDEDAANILPGLGFTPDTARDVAALLVSGELARFANDTGVFTIAETLCAADAAQDVETLTTLLAQWDAQAAQAEAEMSNEDMPHAAPEGGEGSDAEGDN